MLSTVHTPFTSTSSAQCPVAPLEMGNTTNPVFQFKPIFGKGREERREIVWNFFNQCLSKIYGPQESKLANLERDPSDRTCRLLYDGEKPVGVMVYKKNLSNKVFHNSLKINTLDVIDAADSEKGYLSALLLKVEEVALQLRAQSIHVKINPACSASIAFFKKNGFAAAESPLITLLESDESNRILLMKRLTTSQGSTKRKSLETSQGEDCTFASKASAKRSHTSNQQTSNEFTEQSSASKSQGARNTNNSSRSKEPEEFSKESSEEHTRNHPFSRTHSSYNPQNSRDRPTDHAHRTQYVARRSLPHDPNRSVKPMEATLKKIYVDMIKKGSKTIEGRINSGMFSNLHVGQFVRFFYSGRDSGEVRCEITKLNKYESFEKMLRTEGFKPCLPDACSLQDAINTYHSIPTFTERAKRSGVIAIHLKKISE